MPGRSSVPATAATGGSADLAGTYDNHEQVWQAGAAASPRVRIEVVPLSRAGWYGWTTRFEGSGTLVSTLVLRVDMAGDAVTVIPYRGAGAPLGKAFDPAQWTPLDACALRGNVQPGKLRIDADATACASIAAGLGAEAALLPLSIERDGDWLRTRLYADQARGAEARSEARRVVAFTGWAAVNGAGRQATADNTDWHMSRDLRLDNEGGRVALAWRDGKPSGYSLLLERLTYRESGTDMLKLSVVEDASGAVVVYAWADPTSSRIGVNLGWVQVGLERAVSVEGRR
ncbi:hypothetical protein ACQQ2N_18455 [Dokdonella sp. MW10]|uniref:hypothetical protein n=1 Tax=Dokdonella sp. MW10 TaxID=2992926 RepID=UPI003F7DB555